MSSAPARGGNSSNPVVATSAALGSLSGDSAEPNPDRDEVDALARSASEKTVTALRNLASRLGYVHSTNLDPLVSKLPRSSFGAEDVAYCKAALILQQSQTDVYSVLERQSSEQHFVCKYCYLEISDFQFNASKYTTEDWSLLASCHILACPSFHDRRAAYRCFACFAHGENMIEPSAAVMRQHLDVCHFRKTWNELREKRLCWTMRHQSSPVKEPEPHPCPSPLALDFQARGSFGVLPNHSASRLETPTQPTATAQPDAPEIVVGPDQNRPATMRRPVQTTPSSVSANLSGPPAPKSPMSTLSRVSRDQTAPPVPPLPKSTLPHMAVTAEFPEMNNGAPETGDFTDLPGSFPKPEPPVANNPRTPRHPNRPPPGTPTPMIDTPSPTLTANRPHITGHAEDLATRGRLKSSPRNQHSVSSSSASASLPSPTSMTHVNGANDTAEAAKVSQLEQLGIPRAQAENLLRTTGGNLNEAAELSFRNQNASVPMVEDQGAPSPARERRRSRSRRWLERLS